MEKNDGGPAFPAVIPVEHSEQQGKDYPNFSEAGMSLRDYFAGQALGSLVHFLQAYSTKSAADGMMTITMGEPGSTAAATLAYRYADAMLEERKKGG